MSVTFGCICGFITLIVVAIFCAIEFLIVFFSLRATILYPEIPTVEIESFTVSNLNLSNPISTHWKINMSMHNDDSSFEFANSSLSVFQQSKEEALWMTRLKGFDMRPENTTIHFALEFNGIVDMNVSQTVKAIGDSITNNHGAVEFDAQFKADHPRGRNPSRLKKFGWIYETNVKRLIISCDVLLLVESPDKTWAYLLMTNNQACQVDLHPSDIVY